MTNTEFLKSLLGKIALFGFVSAALRGFKGINLPIVIVGAVVLTGYDYYRSWKQGSSNHADSEH